MPSSTSLGTVPLAIIVYSFLQYACDATSFVLFTSDGCSSGRSHVNLRTRFAISEGTPIH
ncbi:hypothetical protein L227DRAFT_235611 [Lentinus tigrinus ALCF2SS1-6]|uniref:Uncharacterized protein n=1 Tax=Lentinus tigrinus ALCF2SS1-6 TaxID=1328759 RepID=A0A5C2S1H4_9APHY|nr:hypothetical protein L227DRAFT_235611 [Lentinus tigrinus ALCF2SS1-6]